MTSPLFAGFSGLYFPQSFLTGTLQTFARKHNLALDSLQFDFQVLEQSLEQEKICEMRANDVQPEDGVLIHGIFIEAGRWDAAGGGLCDGQLSCRMPVVWLKPCTELQVNNRYECPLYKTPIRAGVLSTTGHSSNFILSVLLQSKKNPDFWILRGTALVTLLTN